MVIEHLSGSASASVSTSRHGKEVKRASSDTVTETVDVNQNSTNPTAFERDDWAEFLPASGHAQFFKSVDWAASELGPLKDWSIGLRIHTFSVLADTRSAILYWGPNKIAIYNEAFIPLAGKTHPHLMGTTFQENFPEIWNAIGIVFDKAEETGVAANVAEVSLFVERSGFIEEAYFTGNFNPLRGNTGKIEGFYNSVYEVTTIKIRDRRRDMLKRMQIPSALHKGNLASYVMPFLELNALDITMALLYEVDEETAPGECLLNLKGNIGVPKGHPLLLQQSELNSSEGIFPFLSKDQEGTIFPVDERFNGVEWRGFGEPSLNVSVLRLSGAGRLFGFLVVGNNPRRAIDDDHSQFIRDLSSSVSSIAASLISADESRKRAERLERELADSEKQIRYMAQNASVGMQHLSVDGTTMWANDQYYNITGHPRHENLQYKLSFIDVFTDEDRPKALDAFNRLTQGEHNVSVELRLKRVFTPPSGDPEPACILSLSFPFSEDGKVKSIMTCTTDVSSLKWAESTEARNAADAREAKRQQEEFIDLVSHELRNPLSAIFQLADTIITSFPKGPANEVALQEALLSNIEAANTILMCAKHQKRIVDDVLTLSKLEYMMLSVSPRPVQLPVLIHRSVRMFDADMIEADIKVRTSADPSLNQNGIDWVLCDPSRLTQIFINLLTNAIKFTKTEPKREIFIKYGVMLSDPRSAFPKDMNWAPNQKQINDLTLNPEWGVGEQLYLTLTVTDTGVGMTSEQIIKLFSRFQQASARTSIKYGGSGLGLFISQKLTEKQGGEIGVISERGKGSTFICYVKARRSEHESGSAILSADHPIPLGSFSSHAVMGLPDVNLKIMHVLLVEDNIVNQKILWRQLTTAGCVVTVANHGLEALEMLKGTDAWRGSSEESKHLDIILMDWEMPVMDGLTASREVRKLQMAGQLTRHIEIIATTANAREEQVESALASGIDYVMSKPFMVADLLKIMRERLSIRGCGRDNPRTWISP